MINRNPVYLAILLLGLALMIPVSGFAKSMDVTFNNDRINIYADNVSLSSIVDELSRQMSINVYLDKTQAGNNLTVDIRNTSFEKGLKMLTYPLNYVIVRGSQGEIRELRIFKNPGLADNNYKLFAHVNTVASSQKTEDGALRPEVRGQRSEDRGQRTEVRGQEPAISSQQQVSSSPKLETRNSKLETASSEPVTGERALNYGMWAVKRMMAYEAVREQEQVRADQMESAKKEMAPVQNLVNAINMPQQTISAASQQTGTSSNTGSYYSGYNYYNNAGSSNTNSNSYGSNNMNTWQMNYMQSAAQQTYLNNYMYYQQRMYGNNNYYNSISNSRGPLAR